MNKSCSTTYERLFKVILLMLSVSIPHAFFTMACSCLWEQQPPLWLCMLFGTFVENPEVLVLRIEEVCFFSLLCVKFPIPIIVLGIDYS